MSSLPPHMRRPRPPMSGGPSGSLRQRMLSNHLNSFASGSHSISGHLNRHGLNQRHDYTQSCWSSYFTSKEDLQIDSDIFRVYIHEEEAHARELPLLVLLHGGGFSGLTWSVFVKSIVELCHVRVLALDLRGHGSTKTSDDADLSIVTLTNDITRVLNCLYEDEPIPEIILMGHSMGGAIAIHYADKCTDEAIARQIIGLIVIDVVEGTAKDALSSMQQVLRSRPSGFKSVNYAIEWYMRSGQVRNIDAAKISMPGQIKSSDTLICATDLEAVAGNNSQQTLASSHSNIPSFGLSTLCESMAEESEDNPMTDLSSMNPTEFAAPQLPLLSSSLPSSLSSIHHHQEAAKYPFIWRINLTETEKFWTEWFDGLSQIFLGPKGGAKLLLLAGIDRLDSPMTIGQMQGKFQMQVLPQVGHTIQEDDPDSVANVVASYLVRNRFSVSKIEFETPFPLC